MVLDVTHWQLRGPVKSMRSELAERDLLASDWAERRFHQFVVFDESGRAVQLDQRGAEASIARTSFTYDSEGRPLLAESGMAGGSIEHTKRWQYDASGREVLMSSVIGTGSENLREVSTYDDRGRRATRATFHFDRRIDSYAVDGSELGYGAPGAVAQMTRYDEAGRPVESDFLDASGAVIRRVTMTRDAGGRVLLEESSSPAALMFPREPGMSDDDFRQLQAMLAATGADAMRTAYEYDTSGRRTSRAHQWGLLGEERVTYRYDGLGNPVEEVEVSVRREIGPAEDGTIRTKEESRRSRELRFAYVYDGHGNWTERMVSTRITESGAFAPQNAEWRTIEYYDGGGRPRV